MDWYQARKKMIRHERYLQEKDWLHGTTLLGDAEVASDVDIYKAVERNILYAKLHAAIAELNEADQHIISCIYFHEMSIRQYALKSDIAYTTAWEQHQKALKRLENLLRSA